MRYEVPQFIEEEMKIIGPLSIRQFFLFLAAMLLSFVFFFLFQVWLWAILTLILFGVISILAFGKMHGRPMSTVALHALRYFWSPRRYLWKREALKAGEMYKRKTPAEEKTMAPQKKKAEEPLTPERIKELAKRLDRK